MSLFYRFAWKVYREMKKNSKRKFAIFFAISSLWVFFVLLYLTPQITSKLELLFIKDGQSAKKEYLSEISFKDKMQSDFTSELSSNNVKSNNTSTTKVYVTDPRVVAMRKFLIDYGSPMYAYADVFIYEADQTGLDWRLVASISGVESAFGRKPIVPNNAWGWKGGANNTWSNFPTWREGIQTVSEGLSYWYKGLTPYEIEPRYCPDCFEGNNYSWANGVQGYMNELNYYLQNLESL